MFSQHVKQIKYAPYFFLILLMLFGAVGSMSTPAQITALGLMQFSSNEHALGFSANGIYVAAGTHALHIDFANANDIQPLADSSAETDDKAAPLQRVTYPDLWPGINLTYDAPQNAILRSTYTLQPGADPKSIRLHYNAPLSLNEDGILRIAFETGAMLESAPLAWQEIRGRYVPVDVRFFLSPEKSAQTVTFVVGAYDPRYPLTIDPSLTWNTFLGGDEDDFSRSIAIDASGNIYVAGNSPNAWSCSPVDCTVNPYTGKTDAFVAKLDAASGALIWNTFLGGNEHDDSMGITVDGNGIVYVSGYSAETWGSPLRDYGGGDADGFAAKLDGATGALIWNTFLGGSGTDRSWGIAVDEEGNIYVTGNSPAAWSCAPTECTVRDFGSLEDAFTARLDSSGNLVWNTFLGGGGTDVGYGITRDESGNIYIAGYSTETWGNPPRAYTSDLDGFAAKLDAASGALTWNTFLGGSGSDIGYGIAIDGNGNLYVAGSSYATWGSPVRDYGGGLADGFAIKLDDATGALSWNTFLGGSGYDYGYGIAVDGNGNVYVAGGSDVTWGNPLRAHAGNLDGFAAKLASSGALTATSFLGGSGDDKSYGIAAYGGDADIYVSGYSDADWGDPSRAYTDGKDTFAAKLDLSLPLVSSILRANPNPTRLATVNFTVTFSGPVTDVDKGDFSLAATGTISGATITSVSGSDATRTVAVSRGTGIGTLRLDVPNTATITNLEGVPLSGLPYTSGQSYIIVKRASFRSQGSYDGWIRESTETSNKGGTFDASATTIRLGDNAANRQYRAILSFSTANLPDNAIITKVVLKIKKAGLVGIDPFTVLGNLLVDMRKPFFGATADLVSGDFQAAVGKASVAKFGVKPVNNWYNAALNAAGRIYINKTGTTQFRLFFVKDDNNDNTDNYVFFYSGNYATASVRPTLIIEYYVP